LRERTPSSGSKFTVLSVAAQRAWKNTQDEWVSKTEWHPIAIFQPRLAEYVMQPVRKGSHVLIEGSLTSSTFERASAKAKRPERRRSPPGRFVKTVCACSTAANRSPKQPLRALRNLLKRATLLSSSVA
jgi:single-stranded DNA-binding protein